MSYCTLVVWPTSIGNSPIVAVPGRASTDTTLNNLIPRLDVDGSLATGNLRKITSYVVSYVEKANIIQACASLKFMLRDVLLVLDTNACPQMSCGVIDMQTTESENTASAPTWYQHVVQMHPIYS